MADTDPQVPIDNPQDALTFAYIYGYPLYAYACYVGAFSDPKVNTPYPFRNLATPEDHAVVRPNVDTLYTPLFFDVSQTDLEFVIPEFDNRYWLWPWYDLYGNNFANIGSLQGFKPGKYLLRFSHDSSGVQTHDLEDGYCAYVNSPTPYGLLLNRILVKHCTPSDLGKVHALQDRMSFAPKPRKDGFHPGLPALDLQLFSRLAASTDPGLSILKLTAHLSRYNPPMVLTDRAAIASTLHKAGISSATGTFTLPPDTDLQAAIEAANALAASSRKAPCYSEPLGNNWTQPAASISGNFGSHYAARMFSAQRGYLILSRDQAAYPGYTNPGCVSGADRFFIGPQEAYILTFASGMPRLKESGFWSLTIYGEDQFLVPNERGVYNLGDRSGLVDRDGRELKRGEGREFKILIQAANAYPPQDWVKNWLPAPRGGGTFMMSFRFYGAEEAMFDGTWVYPVVEKVGALRA